MKGILLASAAALLALAGALEQQAKAPPAQLVVTMPEPVAALWPPGLMQAHAFAGGQLVAWGTQAGASLVFETKHPEAVDRLLLLGGSHARWAERTADGFFWDAPAYAVSGRLPQDLGPSGADFHRPIGAYIDVLRPPDSVPAGVRSLYPSMGLYRVDDERFVVGVPAPGPWDVIVDFDGGAGELIVTCEAVLESALPAEPPEIDVHFLRCGVRLDLTGLADGERRPKTVSFLGPRTDNGSDPLAGAQDAARFWRVGPRDLTGRKWLWAPGWELVSFDGSEFTTLDTILERRVRPARRFQVRVRDSAGEPVVDATVGLRKELEVTPAAWGPVGGALRLWGWGRTGMEGVVQAEGVPAPQQLRLEVHAKAGGIASADVTWTGDETEFEVVLDR